VQVGFPNLYVSFRSARAGPWPAMTIEERSDLFNANWMGNAQLEVFPSASIAMEI
jgi:hypothetical protein